MTTGDKIKQLRKQANMTQTELGKKLGVQQSAIRKYEHGDIINIPYKTIQKIAEIFSVTPEYLVGWDSSVESSPATAEDIEKWDANAKQVADTVHLIEQIQGKWGDSAVTLLRLFNQLNEQGQNKILDNINDLLMIDQYTKQ